MKDFATALEDTEADKVIAGMQKQYDACWP
jgi:hypothetical protein